MRSSSRSVIWLALAWAGANGAAPAAERFAVTDFLRQADGSVRLSWTAETNSFANLFFLVQTAPDINSTFTNTSAPISETLSLAYTDSAPVFSLAAFYRVTATPAFTTLTQPGAFAGYSATNVNGLNTIGYAGSIFDGRYIYFVPYKDATNAHGRVLRYDTQAAFSDSQSWAAYDASGTGSGGAVGYTGGAFDGRYIYFSPQGNSPHGRVLRYDTQGQFQDPLSWALHDASITDGLPAEGFQGAVFDGRYIYFVPHYNGIGAGWNGIVLRYDTSNSFTNSASWHAYDASNTSGLATIGYSSGVFDGRYVYFVPTFNGNANGNVLRYDSQAPFTNAASWVAYDASHSGGLNSAGFKGAVFDGRFLYFAPYLNSGACVPLRYDTLAAFTNAASWTAYNASNTDNLITDGYDGAVFDGRFVYFTPYANALSSTFHGHVLAYDTENAFTNAASWHSCDAGNASGLNTQGYIGAISDGRYIYFAPYRNNSEGFHANVLRFDARLPRAVPQTVSGGSNL